MNLRLYLITIFYSFFEEKSILKNKTLQTLLEFPQNSLGKELGNFHQNNTQLIDLKLQNNELYLILTENSLEIRHQKINEQIRDQIALQYLLFGNGKRTFYQVSLLFIGTLIYPEFLKTYLKSYRKGKNWNPFYSIEFDKLLHYNVEFIRSLFSPKSLNF